jgi:hypothetical protein
VDPLKRRETPEFYGYVPDGLSRSLIFTAMTINGTLLLLIRSVSAALLILTRKRYFAMYFVADNLLYILQKIVRGDFYYWAPVEGPAGAFLSFFMRVGIKTVVDFTGVVQFRHPYEMGGAYFSFSMVLALLVSYAAVYIHFKLGHGETGMRQEDVWTLVLDLSGAWTVSYCTFFLLMKKKYRRTFFSLTKGKQVTIDYFLSDDDAIKSACFGCTRQHWKAIEPAMEEWVKKGWWRWENDNPVWFTDQFKASVPEEWIPSEELNRQIAAQGTGTKGRKSSLMVMLAGGGVGLGAGTGGGGALVLGGGERQRRKSALMGLKGGGGGGEGIGGSATIAPSG